MASKETEFLDSVATIEKVEEIASRRTLNRRNFMAAFGMTSAAAGAALVTGCSSDSSPVPTASIGATDVLNFALNLEYLEATFYSYITKGTDLPAALTNSSGTITGAPSQITFTGSNAAQITDLLNEIYYDEMSHVRDLLTLIGSSAIARPAINLGAAGTITASNALSVARLFEDVGATAYAGAAALLSGTTLGIAAQILAVEGFHAGALRLVSIQNPSLAAYVAADASDVKPADPGTATLAAAGPTTATGGFFATAGTANASAATPAGFAFTRSTSQVLAIVYGSSAAGTSAGGFFPSGVNGAINKV